MESDHVDPEDAQLSVIGQTVKAVRKMTEAEFEHEGWEDTHGTAYVIEFESGDKVYASCDDEGNGPGVLFGYINNRSVYVK